MAPITTQQVIDAARILGFSADHMASRQSALAATVTRRTVETTPEQVKAWALIQDAARSNVFDWAPVQRLFSDSRQEVGLSRLDTPSDQRSILHRSQSAVGVELEEIENLRQAERQQSQRALEDELQEIEDLRQAERQQSQRALEDELQENEDLRQAEDLQSPKHDS